MQTCCSFVGFSRFNEAVQVVIFLILDFWRTFTWVQGHLNVCYLMDEDLTFFFRGTVVLGLCVSPSAYLIAALWILSKWCMSFLRCDQFVWMAHSRSGPTNELYRGKNNYNVSINLYDILYGISFYGRRWEPFPWFVANSWIRS